MNNRITCWAVLTAFVSILTVLVSAADDEPAHVKPLDRNEKFFLHAAGLLVKDPDNRKDLMAIAGKSAEGDGKKWADGDDVIQKAFLSIQEKSEFRSRYRASLNKLLDDDPQKNGKKILARIESDFKPEKLDEYRVLIDRADDRKLREGALPWPLCIPFDCCK